MCLIAISLHTETVSYCVRRLLSVILFTFFLSVSFLHITHFSTPLGTLRSLSRSSFLKRKKNVILEMLIY